MAKLQRKTTKTKVIRIKNDLIEAFVKSNNLTALKLLFYIANNSNDIDFNTSENSIVTMKINKSDFLNNLQIEPKTFIRNIIKIQETSISFTDEQSTSYYSIIPRIQDNKNGLLTIDMYKIVLDKIRFQAKQGNYTPLDLEQIVSFTSKHTVRMFMLLRYMEGWTKETTKQKELELEELNYLFGTSYKTIKSFIQRVLLPIQKELDTKSKLSFEYHKIGIDNPKGIGRPLLNKIVLYPIIIERKEEQEQILLEHIGKKIYWNGNNWKIIQYKEIDSDYLVLIVDEYETVRKEIFDKSKLHLMIESYEKSHPRLIE